MSEKLGITAAEIERATPEQAKALEWHDLRSAVCQAGSFEKNPPPQYWLETDAGPSYCWGCAIKVREAEFGLGPLLDPEKPPYRHTELEDAFFHGIDGGSWYTGEGDCPAHCHTCGTTLQYWLTDYGIDEELYGFEGSEFSTNLYEISYALDRLFELVDDDPRRVRVRALAEQFLSHAASIAKGMEHG